MRLLANDRSIVIKKADKGSRVVAWDCEDYIAEASKRLNDESVYKSVKFKIKFYRILQKKVTVFSKVLSKKVKLLKNNLSISQSNIKKLPILRKCICL